MTTVGQELMASHMGLAHMKTVTEYHVPDHSGLNLEADSLNHLRLAQLTPKEDIAQWPHNLDVSTEGPQSSLSTMSCM